MKINKTARVNFGAGEVHLKRVVAENIPSYGAIKKITKDKGIDVFIAKGKETKFLPRENMCTIIASKTEPERNYGQVAQLCRTNKRKNLQ